MIIVVALSVSGCPLVNVMGTVTAGQQWSENYARLPGVEATDPRMVDGDLRTSGETVFKTYKVGRRRRSAYSEAVVKLPEVKMIHKLVIYSPNLKTFSVWADEGSGWKQIKDVKSTRGNPIVVMATARTDRIMIKVRAVKGVEVKRERRRGSGREEGIPAVIQEIELYGFSTARKTTAPEAQEAQKEKQIKEELEDLLEPVK
jgi:hypothetical protein